MMKEYEYSFKVKNIKPFISFCKDNGYKKTYEAIENRIVYENKHNTSMIARITTINNNDGKRIIFDSKNVDSRRKNLKVSRESKPIIIKSIDKKKYISLLEVLDFKEVANNVRKRYVYKKGRVIFEIDRYIKPKMFVVALEGEQKQVEKVYEELKNCQTLEEIK